MPFAGRSTKVLKAETSRIFFFEHNKDMSREAGVRKPNESQKSEGPLENEGGQRQGEDFYDPGRKDNILGRIKRTGCARRAPQRPDCGTGQSFEVCGEFVLSWIFGPRPVVEVVFNGLFPSGLRRGSRVVEKA